MATTAIHATPKQVSFLTSLLDGKDLTTYTGDVAAIRDAIAEDDLSKAAASALIDGLTKLPWAPRQTTAPKAETTNIPEGRYAIDGDDGHTVFVKVDRPTEGKWAGYTFVKVQVSDDYQRVSRAVQATLLAKIDAAGVVNALQRYGLELGSCGHCGRTLTDEVSRELGIGPRCRAKLGL